MSSTKAYIGRWVRKTLKLLQENKSIFEDLTCTFNIDKTSIYLCPKGVVVQVCDTFCLKLNYFKLTLSY